MRLLSSADDLGLDLLRLRPDGLLSGALQAV